jgi:hypothetical protein
MDDKQNKIRQIKIRAELERLRRANDGLLRPVDVVDAARSPKSVLHGQFQWDDSTAAHEYRLWQARELIAVYVTVLPGCKTPVQAYVSLTRDQQTIGGGYRAMASVMKQPELRELLIQQALGDFQRVRSRYQAIKELAAIFAAIDSTTRRHRAKRTA